ncbi:helix-turn-helix domain containing protein [Burkholderia multivorans]|uniref:helix-turn-helix domain containing protein n=1 Tax=Burkholderia multivorans TaxID=87883 RepID=UPI001C211540|nr:helix-turn-helix domain containing protein [Burkholderia multivorans]MBU9231408.1 helix-turn-helix domain containing protein [Burkholderia multivorans]
MELATFKDRLVYLVGDAPPYAWAAKVGIPKGTFTNMWKHGGVPRDETLRKIVAATGCRYEWLASGGGDPLGAGLERPLNPLDGGSDGRSLYASLDQLRERQRDEGLSEGDLMESIIEGVERFAERNGLALAPERKATFIMLFYRYFKEEGQVDQEKLGEMLRKVG